MTTVQAVFRESDDDDDGFIGVDEFTALMLQFDQNISDRQVS